MFVGMDVHKNYLQVVLDEKGKILNNSRVDNNMIKVNEFFDSLHPGNNTKIESSNLSNKSIGYIIWNNSLFPQNREQNSTINQFFNV
jgi:hypothetical protein